MIRTQEEQTTGSETADQYSYLNDRAWYGSAAYKQIAEQMRRDMIDIRAGELEKEQLVEVA